MQNLHPKNAILVLLLVVGCQPSARAPSDNPAATDHVSAPDSNPMTPVDKQQQEKPSVQNEKRTVLGDEDEVVEFLAAREMFTQLFLDTASPIRRTLLQPHFIDWLALGVNEPFDQRLALAQVTYSGLNASKDKTYFDGTYKSSLLARFGPGGLLGCEVTTQLLQENKEYAKNFLTIAERDLDSEVMRKLIASSAVSVEKGFDSTMADYTARTLTFVKKDASPAIEKVHTALRKATREALSKHPMLAVSLKSKIKVTAEFRESHERAGKMIRAAFGGRE